MSKRLLELDALRGIAAISVVVFHINMMYPFATDNLAKFIFKFGCTGVDLFFMISGFVILLTLEKTKNWKEFAISRFSRLYPTYWACVTLTSLGAIIFLISVHKPYSSILNEYLPNMTMFQRYFRVQNVDDVYWTLLVEMIFYIFMLFVFLVKKLKYMEYIALACTLPLFVYGSSYFQVHFAYFHYLLTAALPIVNYFPLFLMGIIYYKMKTDKPTRLKYLVILVCIVCQLYLYGNGLKSDLFLTFGDYVVITLLYNSIFLLYVHNRLGFIVNRVTVFLGGISYPLYLIHYYLSDNVVIPTLVRLHVPLLASSIIALIIAILLATLISKYIEIPATRLIRNKFQKRNEPQETKYQSA